MIAVLSAVTMVYGALFALALVATQRRIDQLQRRQSELRALLRRHVTMRHPVDDDEETLLAETAGLWDGGDQPAGGRR